MIDYWTKVKALAWALKGDGCSGVPDLFYRPCCDLHDIFYRTGADVDGTRVTRREADRRFRECLQKQGKTPILGTHILPFFYWLGVRWFGETAWDNDKPFYDRPSG